MDDAFAGMLASQAKACAPRPAKTAHSDDSLHATDLDAAKMLGGMAINGIREATKRRSQRNLTDAAERAPAPAVEPRRGFFGGKKKK